MTRVYIVEPQGNIVAGDSRLVAANSQGEAIRIVTRNLFTCRVATTIEVAKMIGAGAKLEEAKEDEVVQDAASSQHKEVV